MLKLNARNLYYLSIIAFPFFVIGFRLLGYPLNASFLCFAMIVAFLISQRMFERNLLFSFLLLICWSFLITFIRVPILSFFPSLLCFALVIFPLIGKKEITLLNLLKIDKLLLTSFYVILIYWVYQYIAFYLGLPLFEKFIPLANKDIPYFWTISIKIPRFSSFFMEPSHLVVYLITLHILVDRQLTHFTSSIRMFIKVSTAFMIFATLSLSGIGMLFIYYFLSLTKKSWKIFKSGSIRRAYLNTILIVTTVFILLILTYALRLNNSLNKIGDSIAIRFEKVEQVVKGSNNIGSEAVRLNVITLAKEYYEKEGFSKFIIGEGFSQHDTWVKANAGDRFKEGKIQNTFIILFLSIGFFGLAIFLLFLFTLYRTYHICFEMQIISLLIFFFSGYLIIYLNWMTILLFSIYSLQKNEAKILHNHYQLQ